MDQLNWEFHVIDDPKTKKYVYGRVLQREICSFNAQILIVHLYCLGEKFSCSLEFYLLSKMTMDWLQSWAMR